MATLYPWHSKWNGGKTGRIITYPASPGTVQVIDSDIVKGVKEPLFFLNDINLIFFILALIFFVYIAINYWPF